MQEMNSIFEQMPHSHFCFIAVYKKGKKNFRIEPTCSINFQIVGALYLMYSPNEQTSGYFMRGGFGGWSSTGKTTLCLLLLNLCQVVEK